jgi:beta-galactosidase
MIGERRVISGEMHYARVPRAYWSGRLAMAYAMGLDAVSTYVFWNLHEPQPEVYDFAGENDVAEYVRTAAAAGLDVILRPGPYVCAEWDLGGLPAWLLTDDSNGFRTAGARFMRPVRRWLKRLGEELAPLQRSRGGPIVAVQLENEYGAFGEDPRYLQALREALDAAGFGETPYYTIDQPDDLARGSLAGVEAAVTFGPGDFDRAAEALERLRPGAPKFCGEYWAGWFARWGELPARDDSLAQTEDLARLLAGGWSVNVYMFHGGTNFGFHNGANFDGSYRPVITSYDYRAALDQAGRPTPKYFAFRAAIAQSARIFPRPVPAVPRIVEVPAFALTESAPLESLLTIPVAAAAPRTMESLGQAFGYVLYRTELSDGGPGLLEFDDVRDFAVVSVDGRPAAVLDRRLGSASARIEPAKRHATLDVLVENCGRVNYGPQIARERKGIAGAVRWNGRELRGWKMYSLPLADLARLRFTAAKFSGAPAFFRGRFELAEPHDTFLNVSGLGKGVLFVNGRNAGRFWNLGPQRFLYVPGVWLRSGLNDVVTFDVLPQPEMVITGTPDYEGM